MDKLILENAKLWLKEPFDVNTQVEVQSLINNDERELTESFYKNLEFGTGGLRGIMGVGTNRMNKYTVGRATQGLSNYLLKQFVNQDVKCVIAFDSRNNSDFFAKITAAVFAANGIKVFLFDAPRPTPELSFTVRHLNCNAGVVITASHNPKEYNGYKVYWQDGGQIVPPHDSAIIEDVNKTDFLDIKFEGFEQNINIIGEEIDDIYLNTVRNYVENIYCFWRRRVKIAFSAIHGSTGKLIPKLFENAGFHEFFVVKEQLEPDGNFPTVKSPNPEEKEALKMTIKLAKEVNADILFGTDPDGDRLGVGVKDHDGEYVLLNGNQTAALLTFFVLFEKKLNETLQDNSFIVKTIVTSDLLSDIAKESKIKCYDVLTGFKYIAEIIEKKKGLETFVCGGEESYGFLLGDFVRDKDALITSLLITEMALMAKTLGANLLDILTNIYRIFGFYKEGLKSLTKRGKDGIKEINKMMINFRENPPQTIINQKIIEIYDYQKSEKRNINGNIETINLPQSDVLQYVLEDGTKITIRPSGTEPKIKFYVSTKEKLNSANDYYDVEKILDDKIEKIFNFCLSQKE